MFLSPSMCCTNSAGLQGLSLGLSLISVLLAFPFSEWNTVPSARLLQVSELL